MAQIILKNVTKEYAGNAYPAVKNINLTCEDKELLVLYGPKGCGKTTLLRLIAGLEKPSEGEIYIDGTLVNDILPKDRAIGMVWEKFSLYPSMTVYGNMAFGLKQKHVSEQEIRSRIQTAADILDIQDVLQKKPRVLSGSQRQLVAMGRAVVNQAKIILFDEAWTGSYDRIRMRAKLREFHSRLQTTIIYATDDLSEAMILGKDNRLAVMKKGLIHQIGDPSALYKQPGNKIVAKFGSELAMNFFEGKITKEKDALYFRNEEFTGQVNEIHRAALEKQVNQELIMGIRSEDIQHTPHHDNVVSDNTITATMEELEFSSEIRFPGERVYLVFTTGKGNVYVRWRFDEKEYRQLKAKQKSDLVVDMAKVHYFDKNTGNNILALNESVVGVGRS